jgi:hypothetical protein
VDGGADGIDIVGEAEIAGIEDAQRAGAGPPPPPAVNRHQIAAGYQIEATPILGGLRHQYRLKKVA